MVDQHQNHNVSGLTSTHFWRLPRSLTATHGNRSRPPAWVSFERLRMAFVSRKKEANHWVWLFEYETMRYSKPPLKLEILGHDDPMSNSFGSFIYRFAFCRCFAFLHWFTVHQSIQAERSQGTGGLALNIQL